MPNKTEARHRNKGKQSKQGNTGNVSAEDSHRKGSLNKDKKKSGGSTSNVAKGSHSEPFLVTSAENVHLQREASVGGSWCSIIVFVSVLVAICSFLCVFGFDGLYPFFGNNENSAPEIQVEKFSHKQSQDAINEESPVDVESELSYLDLLWSYYPFGGQELAPEEPPIEQKSDLEESENEEDAGNSGEDDSKEVTKNSDENDKDDLDDSKEKESEEAPDDESDHDDNEEDTDNANSPEDTKDTDEPYNYYNHRSYQKYGDDEPNPRKEEDDSSNESKEDEKDDRDEAYDYNSQDQNEEVDKYKYIRGEDDSNDDSVEQGAREKFDSGENKDDDDTEKPSDDSHSSEEEEHEPIKEEPPSGNMVTKLSVGIALIFVAYSVIIRKWNNYVNRAIEEEGTVLMGNGEDTIADLAQDLLQDELDMLNDRLGTPSQSEGEDEEEEESDDDSVNWQTQKESMPLDSEMSETQSESDSSYEPNSRVLPPRLNITNESEHRYKLDLDDAEDDLDRGKLHQAMLKFEKISEKIPHSFRVKYGMARIFELRAQRANESAKVNLNKAARLYIDAFNTSHEGLTKAQHEVIGLKIINILSDLGNYTATIPIYKRLISQFPDEVSHRNQLGVTYLLTHRFMDARIIFEEVLNKWPDNGVAMANYGWLLKFYGEYDKAIGYLAKGIESGGNDTQTGVFYTSLGDALTKLGKNYEAMKLFEKGVKKGLFRSVHQRSLYNVDKLKAKPWWSIKDFSNGTVRMFLRNLTHHWKAIRDEALKVIDSDKYFLFESEREKILHYGAWKELMLFNRGHRRAACALFPFTVNKFSSFLDTSSCQRCLLKFSLIEKNTHIWPHCGPTNCRLRAHLGLVTPKNAYIRVHNETRTWKEGELLIFDDSFEHEVWNNGTSFRLVLIFDMWHPELTNEDRKKLPSV